MYLVVQFRTKVLLLKEIKPKKKSESGQKRRKSTRKSVRQAFKITLHYARCIQRCLLIRFKLTIA